jgi:hypothetical protein
MPLVLVLILSMSGMIMRVMFNVMALSSGGMMGSIMCWDMGGMILLYGDTMFLEYLLISRNVSDETYRSSMFFGLCADLLSAVSFQRTYVGVMKGATLLAGNAKYEL